MRRITWFGCHLLLFVAPPVCSSEPVPSGAPQSPPTAPGEPLACRLDDDGHSRPLSGCLLHGEHFLREYVNSLRWSRSEFDMCGEYEEFRACVMPLVERCSAIKRALYGSWLPIIDLMTCACNGSRDCQSTLKCFEAESRGILVERCDSVYKFNVRQRTHDPCYFIRENIECKEILVRTACTEEAGRFAFHVAKMSRQHRIAKRRCFISRKHTYAGFRYTAACPADFKDKMASCYDLYLSDHQLPFDTDNELVVRTKRHKEIKSSCRKYRLYRRCMRPLRQTCPSGVDLIYNYDSELRTYIVKMDYICRGENHEKYVGSLDCYQGVLRNRTLMQCNPVWEELKPSLDVVTSYQFYCTPALRDSATLRSKLTKLRTCYQSVFRARCGSEAADVIGRLIEQAFEDPYYLRMQYRASCALHSDRAHTGTRLRHARLGHWAPPARLTTEGDSTHVPPPPPPPLSDVMRTSSGAQQHVDYTVSLTLVLTSLAYVSLSITPCRLHWC